MKILNKTIKSCSNLKKVRKPLFSPESVRMFGKEKEQTSVVYENPYTLEIIGEEPYLSSE